MKISLQNILLGVVASLVALLLIQGWVSTNKLSDINNNVETISDNWLPSVRVTNAMNTNTSDLLIAEGSHIMSTDDAGMSKAEADFAANMKTFRANQAEYEKLISSDEERKIYEQFKSKFDKYMVLHQQLFELSRQNKNVEAANLFRGELRAVFNDYSTDLLSLVNLNEKGAKDERQQSETMFNDARTLTFAIIAIGIALALCAVWVVQSLVIKPINTLTSDMQAIASGNLDQKIDGLNRSDEIGKMAKTLGVFKDGLVEAERLRNNAGLVREQAEAKRKGEMLKLADDFEKSVGGIVNLVASAATEMQASASQLSATAQQASSLTVSVSAAAEQAGSNVNSVAASAEELGASVNEIGRQVETSATIASNAVREAGNAAAIVGELNEVANSIGGVVDMIAGLASQTNFLALNATIESARAGEAGRGFAVVASEVKALAGQTARATTEISTKITQIQSATERAASAMKDITSTIENINQTSTAIASAVEEQTAATQEIVQAVNQASVGTSQVTANISGVAQSAEETGQAAAQVLSASGELAQQAERLNQEMDRFLMTIRAA